MSLKPVSHDIIIAAVVGSSASGALYYAWNDQIVKAIFIPVIGYTLCKIGQRLKVDVVSEIGAMIFFGSAFTLPAPILAYAISGVFGDGLTGSAVLSLVAFGFISYIAIPPSTVKT